MTQNAYGEPPFYATWKRDGGFDLLVFHTQDQRDRWVEDTRKRGMDTHPIRADVLSGNEKDKAKLTWLNDPAVRPEEGGFPGGGWPT